MASSSPPTNNNNNNNNNNNSTDSRQPPFSAALTRKLILSTVENEKQTKLSNDAADLAGELLRLFVSEARHRASIQAECEQEESVAATSTENLKTRIQPHHITKVAADLLMDFTMG